MLLLPFIRLDIQKKLHIPGNNTGLQDRIVSLE